MKRVVCSLFLMLFALSLQAQSVARDGLWWLHLAREQRTGYLAGTIDCQVYEAGNKKLAGASWDLLEAKITGLYQKHAESRQLVVISVLEQVTTNARPAAGEAHAGKHGIFDGEYWRQAEPEHRLGFVEGYRQCHNSLGGIAPLGREDAWYVQNASRWYGVRDDDPGAIDEKRVNRKIADVLALVGR